MNIDDHARLRMKNILTKNSNRTYGSISVDHRSGHISNIHSSFNTDHEPAGWKTPVRIVMVMAENPKKKVK